MFTTLQKLLSTYIFKTILGVIIFTWFLFYYLITCKTSPRIANALKFKEKNVGERSSHPSTVRKKQRKHEDDGGLCLRVNEALKKN